MTQEQAAPTAGVTPPRPEAQRISVADVKDALAKGLDDFREWPTHAVFLVLIYPIICYILALALSGRALMPLAFPLLAGFTLVGPFAALGLYELSRRRELGMEVHWRHALDVLRSPALGSILGVGFVLLIIFLLWLAAAMGIYEATLGAGGGPESFGELVERLFTTGEGWALILIGNFVGFLFALLVLGISLTSFPMMLDRHVDAATAMSTSLRAFARNPKAVSYWGLIVAVGLFLGFLPAAFGLAVVFPVLGHATWHLYRKLLPR